MFTHSIIQALSIGAATLNLAGWAVYLYSSWSSSTKSNPLSWLFSLLVVVNVAVTGYIASGSIYSVLMYVAGVLPCLIAFLFALKNTGIKYDKLFFIRIAIGLTLLTLMCAYKTPEISAILLSVYYLVSYNTMFGAMISGESVEQPLPWLLWCCAALIQCFSVFGTPWSSQLIPFTNLVCWGMVLFLCFWLKKRIYVPEAQNHNA